MSQIVFDGSLQFFSVVLFVAVALVVVKLIRKNKK